MTWIILGCVGIVVGLFGLALLRMAASSEQEAILAREMAGLYYCGTCEWEGDINDWDGEACPQCGGILQLNPRHPDFRSALIAAQRGGMLSGLKEVNHG